MKPVSHKLISYGKLHFFLASLFLTLLFAAAWIPEGKVLGHAQLSSQLLLDNPPANYLMGYAPSINERTLLDSLPLNPEYSTLWNVILGQDNGYRWNGVLALARPLFCLFHIGQVRYFCMGAFFLLLFGAALKISQKLSPAFGFFFLFSFLWGDILSVSYLLNYGGCFVIAFFAVLLLAGRKPGFWTEHLKSLPFIFYGIGAITVFIDPTTVPIITLGIPLATVILLIHKYNLEHTASMLWKYAGSCSLSWSLGFLLMAATKWLAAAFASGQNLFPEYISRLAAGSLFSIGSPAKLLQLLYHNLKAFLSPAGFGALYLLIMLAAILAGYFALFLTGHKPKKSCKPFLPLLPIGMLPFFFYLLAPRHAYSNTEVTFRAFIATLYPLMLFFFCILDTKRISHSLHTAFHSIWRD